MQHETNNKKLALQATTHCLIGCGLGEIVGFIIGTFLGFHYTTSVILGLVLGLVFGYGLGIVPLLNHLSFWQAGKIVATTETLSIVVMEIAEAIMELNFPGMKRMGLVHIQYWIGLVATLSAGFIAAFPINLYLVSKGIRHHH